jgi:hypothetical protein
MTFDPQKFASDARELAQQDVPFRHQGCDPSIGLDCINILRVLYRKQGLSLPDEIEQAFKAYHPKTNGKEMLRLMLKWLIPIKIEDAQIGDIYLFRDKTDARHTAIKVSNDDPPFIVEAYTNGLMHWRLNFVRTRLIVAAFRVPKEVMSEA